MNVPTRTHLLATLLVVVGLSYPGKAHSAETLGPPEEQTFAVHRTILNWLDCEECTAAQLQAVIRLGPKAVPFLAAALHQGPTFVALVSLTRFLKRRYAELQKYKATHQDAPLPLNEREYIELHVSQLTTQYQIRAATALGAVGGPSARLALEQAMDLELPEVVRSVVKDALSRISVPKFCKVLCKSSAAPQSTLAG